MCGTLSAIALFRTFDKLWPPVETFKDAIGLISIEFEPLLTVQTDLVNSNLPIVFTQALEFPRDFEEPD